jgi:hypothetical protein
MHRRRSLVAALAVIVVAVAGTAGAISASPRGGAGTLNANTTIVGTWEATVNRGPALPPVKFLHVFTKGGSIVGSGSDSLYNSSAYGAWEYVGARTYATTHVFHRYSSTGVYLGTHRINANRRLSADGNSYEGVARGELRDPDGNLTASLPLATITATRMPVARIADQP